MLFFAQFKRMASQRRSQREKRAPVRLADEQFAEEQRRRAKGGRSRVRPVGLGEQLLMDDADEIDDDEGVEVAEEVHVAVDDDGGDVDAQIEVAEVEVDIVEEEEEELGNMMEENGPTNDVGARAVPEVPLPLVAAGDGQGGGGAVDQGQGEVGVEGGDGGDAVRGEEGLEPGVLPEAASLPTLQEAHSTYIPTHKWPPKAARPEFTRAIISLWQRIAANPEDERLWVMESIFFRIILPAGQGPTPGDPMSHVRIVKERLRG